MFESHWRHCAVSLSKNINPSLVLVQPRKTRPFITERLLMGRKESNQTKLSRINGHQFQNIKFTKYLRYSSILVICVGNEQIKFTGSIFCKFLAIAHL